MTHHRLALPIAFAAAMLVSVTAAPLAAHQLNRSYCAVHSVPGGIDVVVETSADQLVPVLGLSSANPDDAELAGARDRLEQQLQDHVQARTPEGPCHAVFDPLLIEVRDARRVVDSTMHFECPKGPIVLRNSFRLDVDPTSETVCAIDGAAWVFRTGSVEADVGTPPTLGSVLRAFVVSGARHVATGIDHILFLVALLVAAAARRKQGLTAGLRAMAAVVTGFTLGHSVTLIAAGLGVIRLAPRITESMIALSIVFVGVENALRENVRLRMLTASAFGLVHGFGFASVLANTELPRRGTVWALLAFNVGIELAQLSIVAVLFPVLALLARRDYYRSGVLVPVSVSVAALAAIWFVKRAAGLEFLPWLGS